MHVVNSPESMEKLLYKVKPNGIADVWLRNNGKISTACNRRVAGKL